MGNQGFHEKNFFLLTAVIVLMLGFPTLSSLVSEPIGKSEVTVVSEASSRGPASASVDPLTKPSSVTVEVDCGSMPQNLVVEGSHLRLKSSHCRDLDVIGLSVVNKSNGFTASIFPTKDNQFTTDFMDLAEGNNSFELKLRDSSGQEKTHEIKIQKRAPAAGN